MLGLSWPGTPAALRRAARRPMERERMSSWFGATACLCRPRSRLRTRARTAVRRCRLRTAILQLRLSRDAPPQAQATGDDGSARRDLAHLSLQLEGCLIRVWASVRGARPPAAAAERALLLASGPAPCPAPAPRSQLCQGAPPLPPPAGSASPTRVRRCTASSLQVCIMMGVCASPWPYVPVYALASRSGAAGARGKLHKIWLGWLFSSTTNEDGESARCVPQLSKAVLTTLFSPCDT